MQPIELDGATVLLGNGRPILDRVTLRVPEGASLGLIGPNGSGKSTLLRLVAGLEFPSAGTVQILGLDPRRNAAELRRQVGFVPDQLGVYPRLTILQYLEFFARAGGVSQWERRSTVETMLRVVDLYDARHTEAARLSRGARRRLALARALLNNPPLLVLDDPLGGLDGRGRLELTEVLREIRGMGTTVLISSHLLADLAQMCDSVAVLVEGQIISVAPIEDALRAGRSGRQRVWLDVFEAREAVSELLTTLPGVTGVEQEEWGLSFVFDGDQGGLSSVLAAVVQSGANVAQFGRGPRDLDEVSAALSAAVRADDNGERRSA
ncbi:MAG: ABC transporter ATP-binding protein [Chloroflexota bacterium]